MGRTRHVNEASQVVGARIVRAVERQGFLQAARWTVVDTHVQGGHTLQTLDLGIIIPIPAELLIARIPECRVLRKAVARHDGMIDLGNVAGGGGEAFVAGDLAFVVLAAGAPLPFVAGVFLDVGVGGAAEEEVGVVAGGRGVDEGGGEADEGGEGDDAADC